MTIGDTNNRRYAELIAADAQAEADRLSFLNQRAMRRELADDVRFAETMERLNLRLQLNRD